MSAEREEMPMESEENVEKETEREGDSESSDDSGDEEAADNPRIAELEIQVQNQQVSWWAILKILSIQKIVFLQFWLAVKPGCYRRMMCVCMVFICVSDEDEPVHVRPPCGAHHAPQSRWGL